MLAGTLRLECDEPDWEPLESLVGLELASWFMWMGSIAMEDGAVVHAYKHIATRRYFHLADDGRAFLYAQRGRYREITQRCAIEEAFRAWESFMLESDDPDAVRVALRRAMNDAEED